MTEHTPGPWRWEVHPNQHTVQLCGGRPQYDLTVMTCERWGMRGAAPSFLCSQGGMALITRCDAFMVPIPGREHHADWLQTIAHPDARLLAAAPELLAVARRLAAMRLFVECYDGRAFDKGWLVESVGLADVAIAKADGR